MRAIRLTREELQKLNSSTGKSARSQRRLRAEIEMNRHEMSAYVQVVGKAKTAMLSLAAMAGSGAAGSSPRAWGTQLLR